MTEQAPNISSNPLLAYVLQFQTQEQIVQHALETSKIRIDEKEFTLKEALIELAKSYGSMNKSALQKAQVAMNLHSMLEAFEESTFKSTEQRKYIVNRAKLIGEGNVSISQESTESE